MQPKSAAEERGKGFPFENRDEDLDQGARLGGAARSLTKERAKELDREPQPRRVAEEYDKELSAAPAAVHQYN